MLETLRLRAASQPKDLVLPFFMSHGKPSISAVIALAVSSQIGIVPFQAPLGAGMMVQPQPASAFVIPDQLVLLRNAPAFRR